MTQRTSIRIKMVAVLSLVLLCGLPAPGPAGVALAEPWAEPGDARLRADLETLAAYGLIDRSLTTWPLPVAAISRKLDTIDPSSLPPHARASYGRVRHFLRPSARIGGVRTGIDARFASRPALTRTFENSARGEIDVHASASLLLRKTAFKLRLGLITDSSFDDPDLSFEGSYLAQGLGNLLFYGGTVNQWWGPGEVSSLILSTNARPFPKVGFMRNSTRPIQWKYLNWLGPWQFNVFVGRLEEDRFVSNPWVWGARLTVAPVEGLEIGLSRVAQLCGEGRDCDFEAWTNSIFGNDNVDEVGTGNEPGNQLAGFDVSYSRRVGAHVVKVYGQMIGEDEVNFLPFQFGGLVGAKVTGGVGRAGARWSLTAEYADTSTRDSGFAGPVFFNNLYDHFIYLDGYRYEGEAIAHTFDNDTRGLSLIGSLVSERDEMFRILYHYIDANVDNATLGDLPTHSLSNTAEVFNIIEFEAVVPFRNMQFATRGRWESDMPNTPLKDENALSGEISVQVRF